MILSRHFPRPLALWPGRASSYAREGLLPRISFRLPLGYCLPLFRAVSLLVPVAGARAILGRKVLELSKGRLWDWHRRAWWGHQANRAALLRLAVPARREEVLGRLAEVDWRPVDDLAAQGRGVLLVSAHIGVHELVAAALRGANRPALRIKRTRRFQAPGMSLPGKPDQTHLRMLTARAYFHLREGGLVLYGPDGGLGRRELTLPFLGHDLALNATAAVMARRSGAATLPVLARFEGGAIRVAFGEPIRPEATSPAAWERAWMRCYLDWIETQVRTHPEVVRISHLLLETVLHQREPCGCRTS